MELIVRRLIALFAALLFATSAYGGPSARDLLLLNGNLGPTLNLDFTKGALPPQVTFTRASGATGYDATGTLQTVASNIPRFDHDPVTHAALGLLIEPQSTNGVRNDTMVGAVVGTPGTPPNNWIIGVPAPLSSQVIGTGVENGVSYIDLRVFGTTTSLTNISLVFEGPTQIAATVGQTWTSSCYFRLVGGSWATPAQGPQMQLTEFSSGGSNLQAGVGNILPIPTSSALTSQRAVLTYTTLNSSVAFVRPLVFVQYSTGTVVDFTLRIGMPQLEQLPFATSVIATSGSAVTRAGDNVSVPFALTAPFNVSAAAEFDFAGIASGSNFGGFLSFVGGSPNTDLVFLHLGNWPSNSAMTAEGKVGAVTKETAVTGNVIVANTAQKWGVMFAPTATKIAANGVVTSGANATGSLPSPLTSIQLNGAVSFQQQPAGHWRKLKVWRRTLSTAELIQATK